MRTLVGTAIAALCLTLSACGGGGGGQEGGGQAPQNSAPAFGALTFSTPEDTDLTARIPATDANGDAITFAQATDPTRGSVLSLDATTGNITYRPNANATGTDTFTVRATDAGGRATTGTVTITITPVNDLPAATATAIVTDEGTLAASRVVATDVEGDAVTFTLTRAPIGGAVSAFAADGSFTYQPTAQFSGQDSFDVTVTDAQGGSTLVTVPVTVGVANLSYSGSRSQVVIAENNAGQISKSLWDNFTRLIALYELGARSFIPSPPAVVDTTLNGLAAGTAHITGTLDAAGRGTLKIVYSGFSNSIATFNGTEIVDVDLSASTVLRNYKRTAMTIGGTTVTASGSLLQQITTTNNLSGSIVFGFPDGSTTWIRDAQLSFAGQPLRRPGTFSVNTWGWSGTTRIYDPTLGYSDVDIDGSINFERTSYGRANITRPIGRGSLVATGAAQARLWLTSLSLFTFGVELDLGASGRPQKSLAYRVRDNFAVHAGSDSSHLLQAAAAYPFDAVYAEIGLPFFPEGRFSEHRDGTFVTHRWYIDAAPPGSTAQLQWADTPRPWLITDVSGQYLLRLEVSAGATRSTDYLVVRSVPQNVIPGDAGMPSLIGRSIPGASDVTAVGTEVTLDARRSYGDHVDSSTLGYSWTVYGPIGQSSSPVAVNAVPGEVLRFTPSQPGIYDAVFHHPGSTSISLVKKRLTIGAPRFSPMIQLTESSSYEPYALDFDGDGYVDILAPATSPSQRMIMYRGRSGGGFHGGVVIQGLSPFETYRFEDLTGDGRLDLIATGPTPDNFNVSVQLPTGQFDTPVTLGNDPACLSTSSWRVLGTIDVDRDGRNDLIRSQLCSSGVGYQLIVNTSTAGGFNPAQVIALPGGLQIVEGATADVDGDGDKDLIGAPYIPSQRPTALAVLRLNAGGSFDATSVPLSEAYTATKFTVRDINNDGRADVFIATAPNFVVTQNANGTFTETAKFQGNFIGSATGQLADFTDDGRLDLVLNSELYVQRPDGTFEAPVYGIVQGNPVIDVNGDGRPDTLTGLTFVTTLTPP
ncbi:FG-GAP-like repeat-containing protein [Steroidobacter flavus]|uniref:FG-GAP-like repeat-containing protein n=1 Tax=Steroidobacter flavus TaxID=1842136 RepID=A0ABV8T3N1_9GAMM